MWKASRQSVGSFIVFRTTLGKIVARCSQWRALLLGAFVAPPHCVAKTADNNQQEGGQGDLHTGVLYMSDTLRDFRTYCYVGVLGFWEWRVVPSA